MAKLAAKYGVRYKLFREGKFIGIATWRKDKALGPSFIAEVIIDGEKVNKVFIADDWKPVHEVNRTTGFY